MTAKEKQYVEKLKELITVLKLQLDIMTDNKNTDVPQYIRLFKLNIELELEIAELEKQIEQEQESGKSAEEKVKCIDCKMDFPIMETYFNWDTGARRCWTCQVSFLEQQTAKYRELVGVQDEFLNAYGKEMARMVGTEYAPANYIIPSNVVKITMRIKQLKKELGI
jgi:hypothetical protein